MTASNQSSFLFPGQGAYQPGALAAAGRMFAVIDDVYQAINAAEHPARGRDPVYAVG